MEKQDCIIRIAEDNDFQGIIGLLVQLIPNDPSITDGTNRVVFDQILQDPNLHYFVLALDGKIISTCYLNIIPNLAIYASPYGVIENVITDAAMRGKGYGKQLMLFALKHAWQAGCHKVMLQSAAFREDAHRFYEDCGFNPREKIAFIARYRVAKHSQV
ncbi:MAG: GNAT family N-acetyltransferase [Chloroflexi bacterium]|jgi:GNAT superfamily N-acetyltransferase|nr:GNAT family N-acetyltransferase [Chloroflexota bacterium]MBT7081697.1 GNAT family N-acetyltransferase [Chloroflexota bacterium]MBT7289140.1 GNAT family N-acetyltransferase [Chloroflexota bacterium]